MINLYLLWVEPKSDWVVNECEHFPKWDQKKKAAILIEQILWPVLLAMSSHVGERGFIFWILCILCFAEHLGLFFSWICVHWQLLEYIYIYIFTFWPFVYSCKHVYYCKHNVNLPLQIHILQENLLLTMQHEGSPKSPIR